MSGNRAYLDHNATAPARPQVRDAMLCAMELAGNPSSVHAEGRAAHAVLEKARDGVAALVGARGRDVCFTSGGSEAAVTVLTPGLRRSGAEAPSLLLMSATEHVCVREGHRFPADRVEMIPVDGQGLVDLDWLEVRLARHAGVALVSVHAANNETGVVQPLAAISAIARRFSAIFHSDAVQMAGRLPLDVKALGIDVLTLSAHKMGGPKGVGAIIMAGAGLMLEDRLIRGGGQERSMRAGTQNVPGIAGFGAAALAAHEGMADETMRLSAMRDGFERRLVDAVPGVTIFGRDAPRLPNTSAFSLPGLTAERALIRFDLAGVALSSGAACSSGKVKRSYVMDAMGVAGDVADGALRLSLGWSTTQDEIELALATVMSAAKTNDGRAQAAA
jgi:cysteine desulfurase